MSRNTGFVLAAAIAMVGCVDPTAKFEEFTARVVNAAPPPECSGTPADVTGEHLLAITPIIAPSTQIRAITTISNFTDIGVGFTADFAFQPLDKDDGEEVGGSLTAMQIEISTVGCFEVPIIGTVAGAANPISGQDIDADILLAGAIQAEDSFCGQVSGTGNMIDLTGSTFAAVRIETGTRGTDLPTIVGACAD